jgi:hypothetical protein
MKRNILLIALWLSVLPCFSAPVIVGYTNALAVSHYSYSVMTRVGQLRWFFAHASVGDRIMSGIELLHSNNPDFYRFTRSQVDGTPPAATQAGVIYDYMRGNPYWQVKVDDFAGYMANGWRYPLVDIIMNKLCWIDQTADVNYYITNSSALQSSNQATRFVYATMPLMTSEDGDNYLRNVFNNTLRSWVRTNNQVLYDVADIEAHDRNGVEQTFVYNGRVCQELFSGYTTDGGHPDDPQAKQNLAKGLYAVAAAFLEPASNSFTLTKGTYYGLVADTNAVSHQSAGYVTVATTAKGAFSARILLGGKSYSISGTFDANGQAVFRPNKLPLQIALGLSGKDYVTGTLSNSAWAATLTADKAVFSTANPCPYLGKYTIAIPGAANNGPGPIGHGWGTVSINSKGSLKLSGSLADGTRITQATGVSAGGNWPLYVMLYGGQGSVISPLTLLVQSNLNGAVTWTKLGQSKSPRYLAGFTNESFVLGSIYNPPVTGRSISTWTNGSISFFGGDLAAPFTNRVSLGHNDRVSSTSSNKLSMSFSRSSGTFKGTAAVPQTRQKISFQGAFLQGTNSGYGYFLAGDHDGWVFIESP